MKYSQTIGIFSVIILIIACFLPWVNIESLGISINGFNTKGTNFGRPGIMHLYLGGAMLFCFVINKVWTKRTNLFIGAFNVAWAIRNYILLSACSMGECPEKKAGLYLIVFSSCVALIMSLFPKISFTNK